MPRIKCLTQNPSRLLTGTSARTGPGTPQVQRQYQSNASLSSIVLPTGDEQRANWELTRFIHPSIHLASHCARDAYCLYCKSGTSNCMGWTAGRVGLASRDHPDMGKVEHLKWPSYSGGGERHSPLAKGVLCNILFFWRSVLFSWESCRLQSPSGVPTQLLDGTLAQS
jgi:hypothetical protein